LASSKPFSLKLLAKNLDTPEGIPIVAIVEKIVAIEIAAADVPIISGEVIRARVNHKIYPESSAMIVSTNTYATPFPTTCPTNSLHLQSHTQGIP
jgi:hypothetical protein